MKLVFDIEGNGLSEVVVKKCPVSEGNKIWCIVAKDIETGKIYRFIPSEVSKGVELLRKADLLIGHNITFYDIPMLERFYGEINVPTFDTLIVSRLMYPDINNHPLGGNGIKDWGVHLDIDKIEYDDGFESYCDNMLEYCERDVEINYLVYKEQLEFAETHPKCVKLEHMVSKIIAGQVENGIGFDMSAAEELEQDMLMEKADIEDRMGTTFPPIVHESYSEKTGKRFDNFGNAPKESFVSGSGQYAT